MYICQTNTSIMKIIKLFLLSILVMLMACKKEECPKEVDLGEIPLLESTVNLFPYKAPLKKIIFKDAAQVEYVYYVIEHGNLFDAKRLAERCDKDETAVITYNLKLQELHYTLLDSTNNLLLRLEMGVDIFEPFPSEKQIADYVSIFTGQEVQVNPNYAYQTFNTLALKIIIDKRTDPYTQDKVTSSNEEVVLHGKLYHDVFVYLDEKPDGKRERYYYNHEFGIVGFTDEDGNNLKVLDRME